MLCEESVGRWEVQRVGCCKRVVTKKNVDKTWGWSFEVIGSASGTMYHGLFATFCFLLFGTVGRGRPVYKKREVDTFADLSECTYHLWQSSPKI